jgi:peptidoglycan/LPS O-acetylase OafA/YrhL
VQNQHARKFLAIEGLRAWLAWAVVFSHLTYMSAFNLRGLSWFFRAVGLPSVLIFIIVSGFVVSHVILVKKENYISYLVKRFARIFPLLAVTCFFGFFANDLLAAVLSDPRFGDPEFAKVATDVAASNHAHLSMHFLSHLLMLHGAIPNSVLMYSEYAFNMPAWSISLEWQFYIIAPLIIWILIERQEYLILLAVFVATAEFVLKKIGSGTFQPGALPLCAIYFATGILSRLVYSDRFENCRAFSFSVALAIVCFPTSELRPFLIWLVVFFGLQIRSGPNLQIIERTFRLALENRLVLYFGSRSYSIYLCHYPVASVVVWLLFHYLSTPPKMLLLTCTSIPLIILASELAHRCIELPGIALGKRVALLLEETLLGSKVANEPQTADLVS